MSSLVEGNPDKFIVDSIHGDIHFTDTEWKVLDTPPFQRLRRIKQLQLGQLTYPNATHTRFAHSLGTLALMAKILRVAHEKLDLDRELQENLRLAALLHDIGHYPYSHLMENVDSAELTEDIINKQDGLKTADLHTYKYIKHEEFGQLIVTSQETVIDAIGSKERAKEVSDLFGKDKSADVKLTKLLSSSFDLDRLDYLIRDSHAAGVPYGHIDINYLLNSLKVSSDGTLGIKEKALPAVEHFLLARFFMHRTVYFHKTTYGMEEALRQLLKRIKNKCKSDIDCKSSYSDFPVKSGDIETIASTDKLYGFDDSYIDRVVQQSTEDSDPIIALLAKAVQTRKPPKLLKEVLIFDKLESKQKHDSNFRKDLRLNLPSICEKYPVNYGQFLWCVPKPIILEKEFKSPKPSEYSQMTNVEKDSAEKEEKEIIQIFKNQDETPSSLFDLDYSIVSKLRGEAFQIYRLYFVPQFNMNKEDERKLTDNLKKDVSGWDQL